MNCTPLFTPYCRRLCTRSPFPIEPIYRYPHKTRLYKRSARVAAKVISIISHAPILGNSLLGVRLLLVQLIPVHIPLPRRQALPARQRRQAAGHLEHPLGRLDAAILEVVRQPRRLAFLLGLDQRLGALLADQLDPRLGGAADRQKRDLLGLADVAQARIVAAGVALPVRVVGDVPRREGDGIVVLERVIAARRGIAVVGVEGDAVGPVGVDGCRAAEALPDAGRLECVFLGLRVRI